MSVPFADVPAYAYLIPTIPYSCPIPALSYNKRMPHPDTFPHPQTQLYFTQDYQRYQVRGVNLLAVYN